MTAHPEVKHVGQLSRFSATELNQWHYYSYDAIDVVIHIPCDIMMSSWPCDSIVADTSGEAIKPETNTLLHPAYSQAADDS
jgi:hypothetical protein